MVTDGQHLLLWSAWHLGLALEFFFRGGYLGGNLVRSFVLKLHLFSKHLLFFKSLDCMCIQLCKRRLGSTKASKSLGRHCWLPFLLILVIPLQFSLGASPLSHSPFLGFSHLALPYGSKGGFISKLSQSEPMGLKSRSFQWNC